MKTIVWFLLVLSAHSAAGKVIKGIAGKKVLLECGVKTVSNSLVWRRGEELVFSVSEKSGFTRKGQTDIGGRANVKQTTLVISPVKEEDAGQFTCIADNVPQEHTLFLVSVSVSPSNKLQLDSKATFQCEVKGLNSDYTVQWKRPDGSIKPMSSDLQSVTLADNGTWVCIVSHAGETYTNNLNIQVNGATAPTTSPSQNKMISKPSCSDCGAASSSSEAWKLLGLNWWMWVAVGVGSLVVIFLMVFVIVLYKRIKRRKKRLLKMKNTRHPLTPRQYCQCDYPTAAAKPQQGRRREKPSALTLQNRLME